MRKVGIYYCRDLQDCKDVKGEMGELYQGMGLRGKGHRDVKYRNDVIKRLIIASVAVERI